MTKFSQHIQFENNIFILFITFYKGSIWENLFLIDPQGEQCGHTNWHICFWQELGNKPFTSCGKSSKCKKVPVMQSAQSLHFPIEDILPLIKISYFFYQSNKTILKYGFISNPIRIAITDSAETIRCPLYILVWEAPHKGYRAWNWNLPS